MKTRTPGTGQPLLQVCQERITTQSCISGNIVLSQFITNKTYIINVNSLPEGTYNVCVSSGLRRSNKTLIIAR